MPISGRYGTVDVGGTIVSDIRQWQINNTLDAKPFVASNTKAGTGRRQGLQDWTGSFGRYTTNPGLPLMPGELIEFSGFVGPDNGDPTSLVGVSADGPAIIEDISCVWNWEANEIQQMTYNMAGNGPLIFGASGVRDQTTPSSSIQSALAIIEINSNFVTPAYAPICVRQATLNILSANPSYSNSCLAGVVGRRPGILDWNLALVMDSIVAGSPPPPQSLANSLVPLDTYVGIKITPDTGSPAAFWELEYGYVHEYSNFVVNIETGDIVSYTVNISMSVDAGAGTTVDGIVTTPDGSWFNAAV